MTVILLIAFWAFHRLGKGIHPDARLAGLAFGSSIAILWAFGFVEMGGIIPSEAPLRHLTSALRDGTMWTLTGGAAGFLFPGTWPGAGLHRRGEWWAIPMAAIGFTIFHGAQYSMFLTEVSAYPWQPLGLATLLGTGAAVGWMYWLVRPALVELTWLRRVARFTFLGFGVNWVLYTNFYSLFLAWPIPEVLGRCAMDLMGVSLGLGLFEWLLLPRSTSTVPDLP